MGVNDLSGQTLGIYKLLDLLGTGGMGAVYRAMQTTLQREVAVKVLSQSLVDIPGYLERFEREAKVAARLEHPNIVPVYDFGTQEGISYVAMRLLNGGSLADRVLGKDGKFKQPSLTEINAIVQQISSALDYAHERSVIHRDIKPGNIMFDSFGVAYLVDFGIARVTDTHTNLTGTGMMVGTTAFMAPELWRGEKALPASDQYALAVMIYGVLTGRLPFEADTPYKLMLKHVNDPPTPVHKIRSGVPSALSDVLEQALQKEPDKRFPNARAFADAFGKAVSQAPDETTGLVPLPPKAKQRNLDDEATMLLPKAPASIPAPLQPWTPPKKSTGGIKPAPASPQRVPPPVPTPPLRREPPPPERKPKRTSNQNRLLLPLLVIILVLFGILIALLLPYFQNTPPAATEVSSAGSLTPAVVAVTTEEAPAEIGIVFLTTEEAISTEAVNDISAQVGETGTPALTKIATPTRDENTPESQAVVIVPSATDAPTETATATESPIQAAQIVQIVPTNTSIPIATNTATPEAAALPTETSEAAVQVLPSDTPTASATLEPTPTDTDTATPEPTATPTATITPSATATTMPTATATASPTQTPTPTTTSTPTQTPTATFTVTVTATTEATFTQTATGTPEPCFVRPTEVEIFIYTRPSKTSTARLTIRRSVEVAVRARAEADDGTIWYNVEVPGIRTELDRLWVSGDEVETRGNCDALATMAETPTPSSASSGAQRIEIILNNPDNPAFGCNTLATFHESYPISFTIRGVAYGTVIVQGSDLATSFQANGSFSRNFSAVSSGCTQNCAQDGYGRSLVAFLQSNQRITSNVCTYRRIYDDR